MLNTIKVKYEYTDNPYTINKWLRSLPDTVALDFEAACLYTKEQQEEYKLLAADETISTADRRLYHTMASASALSHPCHTQLTHLAIGLSESEAKVIIMPNNKVRKIVLNWLITTNTRQIWHNASYDFKHIFYHTGKFPKNYEDSQIMARCILNHVEDFKCKSGLKELAGPHYGGWGISSDYFDITQMYNEKVIEYAGTDGCATFWLWNSMQRHLQGEE